MTRGHDPVECCCSDCCYDRQEVERLAVKVPAGGNSMSVRAKFKVDSIERSMWGVGGQEFQTVKLSVVYGGSEENKIFWKATPAGQITLTCVNPEAVAKFKLGGEVYVDFTTVED